VKKAIGWALVWMGLVTAGLAQVAANPAVAEVKEVKQTGVVVAGYVVQGATPRQEALLSRQMQAMQPDIIPSRIIFVPHWKYLYAARTYRLHVPTGMASKMFTHMASRTVFVDNDYYGGDESLGYWMAHELGHMASNSTDENDAEKAAKPYRVRLRDAQLISMR
jgi:hypothetical protein